MGVVGLSSSECFNLADETSGAIEVPPSPSLSPSSDIVVAAALLESICPGDCGVTGLTFPSSTTTSCGAIEIELFVPNDIDPPKDDVR